MHVAGFNKEAERNFSASIIILIGMDELEYKEKYSTNISLFFFPFHQLTHFPEVLIENMTWLFKVTI